MHSELTEPLAKSIHGARYACIFVYQFSRLTHASGRSRKSDVGEAANVYKSLSQVKKYIPKGFERLHRDGGGEYENVDVNEHSETTPHTSQHNPFSERFDRTFLDPAQTSLESTENTLWMMIKNRNLKRTIGRSPLK